MVPAFLIQQPGVDFDKFLAASSQMLGYSPARAVDNSPLKKSDSERFLSCLAAIYDPESPTGLHPTLLKHVYYSVLLAVDERDLNEVRRLTPGMPYVSADTVARGVVATVISGTLRDWRDAVYYGVRQKDSDIVDIFTTIQGVFCQAGLNVWADDRLQIGR